MADSYLYKTTERNVLSQRIVELSVEFRGYRYFPTFHH